MTQQIGWAAWPKQKKPNLPPKPIGWAVWRKQKPPNLLPKPIGWAVWWKQKPPNLLPKRIGWAVWRKKKPPNSDRERNAETVGVELFDVVGRVAVAGGLGNPL